MSQDNNEAASALHNAIMNLPCEAPADYDPRAKCIYKSGHRDARHAAAELAAASASQSSTAGAAKGGITKPTACLATDLDGHGDVGFTADEAKRRAGEHCTYIYPLFEESDLAHVARQRQESAAVAEGVDTAELPPTDLTATVAGYVVPVYGSQHMREFGAQQREAGRRERAFYIKDMEDTLFKIGALVGVGQDADALISAVAALARQPASEGLTALHKLCEQITNMKRTKFRMPGTGQNYSYLLWEDVIFHVEEARATLFAVPPAKAEGLTLAQEPKYGGHLFNRASGESIPPDEPVFIFRARDVHAPDALEEYASVLTPGHHRDAVVQRLCDFSDFARAHPDRMKEPDTAILAQQAKGANKP